MGSLADGYTRKTQISPQRYTCHPGLITNWSLQTYLTLRSLHSCQSLLTCFWRGLFGRELPLLCREKFQSIQRSSPRPLTSDTRWVPLSRRRAYRQIGFVAEGSGGLLGRVVWEEASGGSQENRSDCVRGFTGTEHVATPPHTPTRPSLPPSLRPHSPPHPPALASHRLLIKRLMRLTSHCAPHPPRASWINPLWQLRKTQPQSGIYGGTFSFTFSFCLPC